MINKLILTYADAKPTDCELLGDLLIEAKGHWGYSTDQLKQWRSKINFTAEYIQANNVKLVMRNSTAIGFFAIVQAQECLLDHFWLKPEFIGKGYGKSVFHEIMNINRALNIEDFHLISDPNAEGFYLKMGAERIGSVYSPEQKKYLPKLIFKTPSPSDKGQIQ